MMGKQENERTLAERLLEPCARGFATPPKYIESVLAEHASAREFMALSRETERLRARMDGIRARGAKAECAARYEEELGILTAAKAELAEMLWRAIP